MVPVSRPERAGDYAKNVEDVFDGWMRQRAWAPKTRIAGASEKDSGGRQPVSLDELELNWGMAPTRIEYRAGAYCAVKSNTYERTCVLG